MLLYFLKNFKADEEHDCITDGRKTRILLLWIHRWVSWFDSLDTELLSNLWNSKIRYWFTFVNNL